MSKAPAVLVFSGLSPTYDGGEHGVTAHTVPAGLPVQLTYAGAAEPPVNAGSYAVTGVVESAIYCGTNEATLTIAQAPQTITFPEQGAVNAADGVDLTATADSGLSVSYAIVSMQPSNAQNRAWITAENHLAFAVTESSAELRVAATQSGDANRLAAVPVTNAFTALQQYVAVAVPSSSIVYDGQPHASSWSCSNAAVTNVLLKYNGLTNQPVAAGRYAVTATIDQPDLYGGGYGSLTITRYTQTVSSFNLPATAFTTNLLGLSAVSDTGATDFDFTLLSGPGTLQGNQLQFTNAGTVAVQAYQAGNSNVLPVAVTQSVVVSKVQVTAFGFSGLQQVYDGTGKVVTVSTAPADVQVLTTYNGLTNLPVAAGNYAVQAIVEDPMYTGSATSLLVVAQAAPVLRLTNPGDQLVTNTVQLTAMSSCPLPIEYSVVSGPASVSGQTLTFTGAGFVMIQAAQAGDGNWQAASSRVSFSVYKVPATIIFSALNQVYDGTLKTAAVQTDPAGLETVVGYYPIVASGSRSVYDESFEPASPSEALPPEPVPPVFMSVSNAGIYAVTGEVQEANYYGTNSAVFTIAKADQTLRFTQQGAVDAAEGLQLTATASSGLPVSYSIVSMTPSNEQNRAWITTNNQLTFSIAADSVELQVAAMQGGDANWNAAVSVTNTFVAFSEMVDVVVNSASVTYDGQPHALNWSCTNAAVSNVVLYYGALSPTATNPPVNVDVYEVMALIDQPDIYGGGIGTLEITAYTQTVTRFDLPPVASTTNELTLSAVTDKGYSNFTFTVNSGPGAISGNQLRFTGSGAVAVKAYQPGTENMLPVAVTQTVAVSKVPVVSLTLTNLVQAYDGSAKEVLAVTDPVGLATVSTYNESTNQPVHVGEYSVRTAVDDAIYSGSTTGLFSIVQGTPGLSLSNPGDQWATAEVSLTATSSCPLEIAYAVDSGPAVLQGECTEFHE